MMPTRRSSACRRARRRAASLLLGAGGLFLATLSVAGGCSTAPPIADARPADLPHAALAPAAWLGSRSVDFRLEPGEGDTTQIIQVERLGSSSGILLGENLLLTNAHVWAKDDEMPARRSFLVHRPLLAGPPTELTFELIASRGPAGHDEAAGSTTRPSGGHPDWALARCLDGGWEPNEVARIHPRAADPTWAPAPGTDLLVAGYSSIFIQAAADGPDAPPPRSILKLAERRFSGGPSVIRGRSVSFRGEHCLTYPASWPSPIGHSGGPVFVRDPDDGGVRLVGVFHTRLRVTPNAGRGLEEDAVLSLLAFDPIAEVLEESGLRPGALRSDGASTSRDP